MDYRIKRIAEKFRLNRKDAAAQVKQVDESRKLFMDFFAGSKPEMEYYDIIINRARFHKENIVSIIYDMAEYRGII